MSTRACQYDRLVRAVAWVEAGGRAGGSAGRGGSPAGRAPCPGPACSARPPAGRRVPSIISLLRAATQPGRDVDEDREDGARMGDGRQGGRQEARRGAPAPARPLTCLLRPSLRAAPVACDVAPAKCRADSPLSLEQLQRGGRRIPGRACCAHRVHAASPGCSKAAVAEAA